MPELPEVETVKNELIPHVVGRCVSGVTLFWEGLVRQPPVAEFRCRLVGQKITGITRRGKYLTFSLNSGEKLVIHLRMTGSLLLKPDSSEPERFIRAILCLDDGTAIHFRDPRKFGRIQSKPCSWSRTSSPASATCTPMNPSLPPASTP